MQNSLQSDLGRNNDYHFQGVGEQNYRGGNALRDDGRCCDSSRSIEEPFQTLSRYV